MNGFTSLAFAFVVGGAATLLLARAAGTLRLVDHPGGRKEHARPVPLVGGLAIFIAFLDHTAGEGFIRPQHRELVLVESSPEKILQRMKNFQPLNEVKWIK